LALVWVEPVWELAVSQALVWVLLASVAPVLPEQVSLEQAALSREPVSLVRVSQAVLFRPPQRERVHWQGRSERENYEQLFDDAT
tara:strand:- start:98149 stop:98403 length:255 start_codon:yes stop_codon:yes gene_type:complete